MPNVYRVACVNPSNSGPYRSNKDFSRLLSHLHMDEKHPTPFMDGMKLACSGLYGFKTLKAFNKWFHKKEQKALWEHGFALFKVTTPEILDVGKSGQCRFETISHWEFVKGSKTGKKTCKGDCFVCSMF